CFNLEEGCRYKITNVRDVRHDCKIHGGIKIVEVENLSKSEEKKGYPVLSDKTFFEEKRQRKNEIEQRREEERGRQEKRRKQIEEQKRKEMEEKERLVELEARRKAKEEGQKNLAELKEELEALQKNIPNIFVDDIKSLILQDEINDANKLLSERKNDYDKYLELNKEMKDIDIKLAKLSSKLAEGEITSDAYETARDDLIRKKSYVEEELWKIQRKIFREEYEKPF
ncbi:MAG: UPF0179 family protein, partial [Thermoplasmatales archaeon]|nr:UPF0179 family protein [Thermoplasmatales archaeon]